MREPVVKTAWSGAMLDSVSRTVEPSALPIVTSPKNGSGNVVICACPSTSRRRPLGPAEDGGAELPRLAEWVINLCNGVAQIVQAVNGHCATMGGRPT
jgi:hypothetical protein